jgi:hypothetical protein
VIPERIIFVSRGITGFLFIYFKECGSIPTQYYCNRVPCFVGAINAVVKKTIFRTYKLVISQTCAPRPYNTLWTVNSIENCVIFRVWIDSYALLFCCIPCFMGAIHAVVKKKTVFRINKIVISQTWAPPNILYS